MGVSAIQSHDLKQGIRRILDRQAAANPGLDLEKWRLVHKFVHAHHFVAPARLARSEQLREAGNQIHDMLDQGPRSAGPI